MDIIATLAKELGLDPEKVEKTVALIDEGNTIPFISRYRKEVTGSMDDTTLRALDDRLQYLRKMDERRQEIAALIAERDIRAVFINGKTAQALYDKHIRPTLDIPAICLPSTSPANAAWSAEKLTEAWSILRNP